MLRWQIILDKWTHHDAFTLTQHFNVSTAQYLLWLI